MGERLLRALDERRKMLNEVFKLAGDVAGKIAKRYPKSTIMLIGSYGRGDFNLWSDIDLLVVIDEDLPGNPLKRLDLIQDLMAPNMEPHIITLKEYRRLLEKKNPYLIKAVKEGKFLIDNLKIAGVRPA